MLVPGDHSMVSLLGTRDELLKLIEAAFVSTVFVRGNEITITGEQADAERVARLFEELITLLERGDALTADTVGRSIDIIQGDGTARPSVVFGDSVLTSRGRSIKPKTVGQKKYVDAIRKNTVVFGIGPAGTGKTYLAMAVAVQALIAKQVNRLILTRPAVEAGEKLGFLPGTLSEKIDPYLRPLYDALYEMIDAEQIGRMMERGTIEVAPLAYMRGRSQPYDRSGPDARRVPPDREPPGRGPRDRLRRTSHAGAGRLPSGPQRGLPRPYPGRCLNLVLRGAPVGRRHPRRPAARQAAARAGDPRDARAAQGGALPPVRAAADLPAGRARIPAGPDGPLRPRPAAWATGA